MSSHPNKPCHIIQFKEVSVMLDCGLWAASVLNFLPLTLVPSQRISSLPSWVPRDCADPQLEGELRECSGRVFVDSTPEFGVPASNVVDFSQVDVILISNYLCMLALPFVTEDTGFRGVVYATEPTLQIGRLFLDELVQTVERSPKAVSAKHWKALQHLLPAPLNEAPFPRSWQQLFDAKRVAASLSRIQMDVYGALTVSPVSSGYCLGSSNWIISSAYEKVAYISGSSTLTTHPRPMDQQVLKNADVLILSGLTQTPTANPDSMLGDLCVTAAMTLRAGGSVLIPCYPSGVVYDLFECLSSHLDSTGLSSVRMFFISPVADSSLAYSNILAEWLSTAKQNKVYIPEEPFPHAQLMQTGRLKHFKNLWADGFNNDYRQPCVVFCGHPSLRFGDSVHFMELWGSNPQHTVIFTEPDFPYMEALAPYQPLAMKVVHCPIDTSLNFTQANKLVKELRPASLAVSATHLQPPADCPVLPLKRGEVTSLPLKRLKEQLSLSQGLARGIKPVTIRPGLALATMTSGLITSDNRFSVVEVDEAALATAASLPPIPPVPEKSSGKRRRGGGSAATTSAEVPVLHHKQPVSYTWGSLDVDDLLARLASEGILDAKHEADSGGGCIIHLPNEDTLITVDATSTHIFCEGEALRLKLRSILLRCLNKF
ncbi:hypothetical protein B566_EDAN016808 [Ephemera danica]|nr:hypothetical protein B566_EDAN016808 [Ephemera danica]